jgi:glutamate-5-semialdehyde dehydrogenase
MDSRQIAEKAKQSTKILANASTSDKNQVLKLVCDKLEKRKSEIARANRQDIENAEKNGIASNLVNRLGFDEKKVESRIEAIRQIIQLDDPVGQPYKSQVRPNGMKVMRVRVPLGVILMIYEARPHVTLNAGAFCLKSGNAAILRGGSEAKICNELIGEIWKQALKESGLPQECVQVITGSHKQVNELLNQKDLIDLVIPRGGKKLIETVSSNSKIPVIKHYNGVCSVYIDKTNDIESAIDIIIDSKCLMPAVCNAAETVLISEKERDKLPQIVDALKKADVIVKGCEKTRAVTADIETATEQDWSTEYLDKIISIKVVEDVSEAIEHINTYGSGHTDSIVTDSIENAELFTAKVDSGVVLVNASTMYCDGQSLGLGAEIGISTDKLHARGPMGLEELTTYKFVIQGKNNVMGEPRKEYK